MDAYSTSPTCTPDLTRQMVMLTMARFVGDTVFSFVLRIRATFIGALLGLLLWSIGAPGDGRGNAYGIAAVCAVAFPGMMFFRAYFPVPLQSILSMVSAILVLGYSCALTWHWAS